MKGCVGSVKSFVYQQRRAIEALPIQKEVPEFDCRRARLLKNEVVVRNHPDYRPFPQEPVVLREGYDPDFQAPVMAPVLDPEADAFLERLFGSDLRAIGTRFVDQPDWNDEVEFMLDHVGES